MQQTRHQGACWLLLGAACAMGACTLTSESYEPHEIQRLDTELGASELAPPTEPPASTGSEPVVTPTITEEALGPTRLVPAEADDEPRASSNGAGERDEPAATDADAPVGVAPSPGADDGSADDLADAGTPPSTESTPPIADEPPTPVAASCEGSSFGSSCYEVFGESVTWDVAEQRCVAWGGHLASVETPAEDAFLDTWPSLLGIPNGDGSGVWLGASDATQDGDFRWLDGSAVSAAAWAATQPDNGAGLDCIEKRNDGLGSWYDLRCSDQHGYVCERPL